LGALVAVAVAMLVVLLLADGGGDAGRRSRRGEAVELPPLGDRAFELRSAGPDGRTGTDDDVVFPERAAK
jgi:hypothetical protein